MQLMEAVDLLTNDSLAYTEIQIYTHCLPFSSLHARAACFADNHDAGYVSLTRISLGNMT